MAMALPTLLSVNMMESYGHATGWAVGRRDKTYRVGTGRVGNEMAVYVTNDYYDQKFHKFISLKWRWWQPNSPADRIRRTVDKAQKIADKLNHEEMYMNHEAELVEAL